jgi:integrase
MPRQRKCQLIAAQYYSWRLSRRRGVWCADGRSNPINLGRHSLGTRIESEAKLLIIQLDLRCAIAHGRAPVAKSSDATKVELILEEGRRLYLDHAARPRVTGGVRPVSLKRYRPVFQKFLRFADERGIKTWNAVTANVIQSYLAKLEAESYAYGTLYFEGTTLKQAIGWLVEKDHLPQAKAIDLKLKKPVGTNTYCWTIEEFKLIASYCRTRQELHWLAGVVIMLGLTGLRISELASLRWDDIGFPDGMIRLEDESTHAGRGGRPPGGRTLKSGRSRSFPIHDELKPVLLDLPRNKDGFVFHGPLGGRIKPDTVRNILIRDVLIPISRDADGAVSTRFQDGRLHSFRHFFCSFCANRGVPQQVVMNWLGHRESGMVQHYYHLHDEESKRQMGLITLGLTAGTSPVA